MNLYGGSVVWGIGPFYVINYFLWDSWGFFSGLYYSLIMNISDEYWLLYIFCYSPLTRCLITLGSLEVNRH